MHKEVIILRSTDDSETERLAQEAVQSIAKAKQLLNNFLLAEKLSAEQLVRIAVSFETQCTAGFIILNQKVFYEKLNGEDLTRIGISHFNFSRLVVTRSELFEKLSSEQITSIGKRQNQAANAIIDDATLYGRLGKEQIRELAMRHSSVANKVLTNPEFTKYFTAEDLTLIAENYPGFSQLISSDAVIRRKLDSSEVKQTTGFLSETFGLKSFLSKFSFSKLWCDDKSTEELQSLLSNVTISPDSKKGV